MSWQDSVKNSGFAMLPSLFSGAEVKRLVEDLEKSTLSRSRAGIRHAIKHSAVAELANEERLINLAEEILGEEADFHFHATLFDKSPSANWLVMWHQDTALPIRERRELPGWGPWSVKEGVTYAHAPASALSNVLALRIHLDDSTESNGPLRVLPGTHSLGVLDEVVNSRALPKKSSPPNVWSIRAGSLCNAVHCCCTLSRNLRVRAPRRVLHVR